MSLFLFPDLLLSQSNSNSYNYLAFKRKSHYFGLTIGYNSSGFKIEHSRRFINNANYKWNEGIRKPGLTLSMITNFKIGEYFDFRVLPSISLSYRSLGYIGVNSTIERQDRIESVFGELPMLIRFTSAPYKDKRVFFITGVKYSYDFSSNSRSDKNQFQIVRISPHDFQFEIGAGLQFYLPYFIFSPEIKFSHGINNILIYDNKLPESTIIEKLFSRSFTVSFHFEG
ncbi:MAG: PorT family protein [Saprospiraceae bacterium]|nr:PorT family protein [Saprospiraceae bacterium]MBK8449682.1 PorT family protein [Saprospiraceae bacterium]MBK8484245.1 PorT family protein [Saprospiraceae bacterium]MBK9221643.1 PorT family protein [Saprospiraceae bacterium]MBK9721418.1 PorT family protein [Saprospiraceae bacterium]